MLKSPYDLLKFISQELKTPVTSLASLSNGMIFIKLISSSYTDFPVNKIQRTTSRESQFVNLKILQTFLSRKGFSIVFSSNRIMSGSSKEILELAQFVCNLVETRRVEGEGSIILEGGGNGVKTELNIKNKDKLEKENSLNSFDLPVPGVNFGVENREFSVNQNNSKNVKNINTASPTKTATENIPHNKNNKMDFNKNLSKLLFGLENERNFYYKKLKKIEDLIKTNVFINRKKLEDILYE
ncbi:Microtubule integrity protein mal3 [Cucumispora dikerogammari]|nr:Microtubule integrity protein mal3 [Cucumispora dikerogammari]